MPKKNTTDAIKLGDFLPYLITFAAHRVAKRSGAIAKSHDGLNLSHWRVLAAVAEEPGRAANEVVAVTPMDKGIVSRSVKTLLDLKLLEREASSHDGRIAHLYLTRKGAAVYDDMAVQVRGIDELFDTELSATERKTMTKALKKISALLE